MTNTLRESIGGRHGGRPVPASGPGTGRPGRPLLLGGETLNGSGLERPSRYAQKRGVGGLYPGGLWAPNFQWSDDLFESNSLDLSYGFSVCRVPHPEDNCADWIVDIEMLPVSRSI